MELKAWCIFLGHRNRRFAHGTHGLMLFSRTPPSCICTCNLRLNALSNDTAILDLHMQLTTLCVFQEHRHRRVAHGIHGLMHFPRTSQSYICTWNSRLDAFSKNTAIEDLHVELTTWCVYQDTAIVDLHMELTIWCVSQDCHHRAFARC